MPSPSGRLSTARSARTDAGRTPGARNCAGPSRQQPVADHPPTDHDQQRHREPSKPLLNATMVRASSSTMLAEAVRAVAALSGSTVRRGSGLAVGRPMDHASTAVDIGAVLDKLRFIRRGVKRCRCCRRRQCGRRRLRACAKRQKREQNKGGDLHLSGSFVPTLPVWGFTFPLLE